MFGLLVNSLFTGCSLDEESIRIPVADTYYKTEEGAKKLINACYSYTRIYGGATMWYITEQGTDLYTAGGDGFTAFCRYDIYSYDYVAYGFWYSVYDGITACNTLLDRADGIEASSSVVDNLKGQAHFLRGFFFANLAMQFGGVVLQVHEVTQVETTAQRSTEQEVWNQAISDLLEAEKLLPTTQSDYGRATKAAAQAFLARVYLWTKQWANAATYAKKVIDSNQFKLLDDFGALWDCNNQLNEEVIWSVQWSKDLKLNGGSNTSGNWGTNIFMGRYDIHTPALIRTQEYGRPFRYFMPTRWFLMMLHENQWWDSRFDRAFRYQWNANNDVPDPAHPEMVFGDTALFVPPYAVSTAEKERTKNKYVTLDLNYMYDETTGIPNTREIFPSLLKFYDPERPTLPDPGSTDVVVLRLAEMYLIAAEALMEQGNKEEGVAYLNVLRKRAAWTDELYEQAKLKPEDLTTDAILLERALELAGECQRWPDLKRTGKLLERVNLCNPDAKVLLKEYHLLRPIPQTFLDRLTNKDEFPQNPGY
jgi:hypothetical protein